MGQPTGLRPQGDYGDPSFNTGPPLSGMAQQLMGGQATQGLSNNFQFDANEGGGIRNAQQYEQPLGGQNDQPNASLAAPAVMPSRQQPMGKGGRNVTMPRQGGQPRMGMPNAYSNTIQPWDNANIQPQSQSGKGKG